MASEFIVKRPEDEVGKRVGRVRMLARAFGFIRKSDFARSKERGGTYGKWRPRVKWFSLWRERSARAETGDRFFIQRNSDRKELIIHKVERLVEKVELHAHPALEAIHASVWAEFKDGVRTGGLWFCRFVAGTSTVSRHGYRGVTGDEAWFGAAEDLFGVGNLNSIAGLKRIADHIVAKTKGGALKARTVIYADRVWTPSAGWQHYAGEFHTHVHVDVEGGRACKP